MKKIEIVVYYSSWPSKFEIEKDLIKSNISGFWKIYHIGSNEVPGLAAKRDIDIILAVKDLKETLKL